MAGGELKIDVSLVSKIKVYFKSPTHYKWLEARNAKPAFWPWNRQRAYPAKFYWRGIYSNYDDTISMEKAKEQYIIEEDGTDLKLYEKPSVYIVLKHVEDVKRQCDSDQAAIDWANKLAEKTGKTFETITYK